MQKNILLLVLLSFSEIAFSERLCVIDDSQSEVCLQEPAKRIITLSPHATELIFYVGAGEQVIGVIDGSNYPDAAKIIPRIGDYRSVSVEKIVSLKPDLIIAWPSGNSAKTLAQLQGLGMKIYYSEPAGILGIVENIKELATLTGNENTAAQSTQKILNKYSNLKKRYERKEKVKAVILVSAKPLMTLSKKHAVSETFNICGAENVFKNLPAISPTISRESLLAANPDLILITFPIQNKSEFLTNLGYKQERKPELRELDPDSILLQTPRMLVGIEKLCELTDMVRQ